MKNAAAVLALAVLAGCSKEGAAPPAPPLRLVRVVGAPREGLDGLVDSFHASGQAERIHVVAPQSLQEDSERIDLQMQILASQSGGVDLLVVKPHAVNAYCSAHWVQPLDVAANGLTTPLGPSDLQGVDPEAIAAYQKGECEDMVPALPLNRSAVCLLYWSNWNGSAEWADAKVEEAARTFDGLRALLEATAKGTSAPPLVLDGREFYADFLSLVRSNGGRIPAALEAQRSRTVSTLAWLQGLIQDGLATPIGRLDETFQTERQRRLGRFRMRQSPMYLGTTARLGTLRTLPDEALAALRAIPLPSASSATRPRSVRLDDVLVLNGASMRKDEAVRFLRHLANPHIQAAGSEARLVLPAVRQAPSGAGPRAAFLSRLVTAYDAMEIEVAPFPPGIALLVEDQIHRALAERCEGECTPPSEIHDQMELRLRFEMTREAVR